MEDVDVIIRGHLEEPRIAGSASELLTQLYKRGRVSQFRYGEVAVGSVDLTRRLAPDRYRRAAPILHLDVRGDDGGHPSLHGVHPLTS